MGQSLDLLIRSVLVSGLSMDCTIQGFAATYANSALNVYIWQSISIYMNMCQRHEDSQQPLPQLALRKCTTNTKCKPNPELLLSSHAQWKEDQQAPHVGQATDAWRC